ncbi:EAL domain-containing protein [Arenimonas sp.]|uniref:EAL domain-containing protein n=1 Tax=Arenimonas sp. TaxID=1872635 RepID=UPI0039E6F8D4
MASSEPLRVLLVEDSVADAEMIARALKGLAPEMSVHRVVDEPGLREALERFSPHIVLCDYSMPGFGGQDALRVVTTMAPDLPFIFVSGTIGEEVAIDALQRGAADYVLKENLRRLQPAIERALRVGQERSERLRIERALRASEERFRAIVESTADWMWEMDQHGVLTYSNGSVAGILGYAPEELIGRDGLARLAAEDRADAEALLSAPRTRREGWRNWILRWRHRDGSIRFLESTAQPRHDENGAHAGYRGVDRDVTLRIQQEARIAQLGRIHAVLAALGNAVLRSRDTDALFDTVCRVAVEQGLFRAALIALRSPDDTLRVGSSAGDARIIKALKKNGPLPLDSDDLARRPAVRALSEGRRIIVRDCARADVDTTWREVMASSGIVSHIALPIGRPAWGVLGLYSETPQEFDEAEIELLERLTAEIDYAQDFIAKSERLEYLAYHNPDTGFPNRAAFQDRLAARIARGQQVVAMVQLERLRHYGQSRGRGFAGRFLQQAGERLRGLLPAGALFSQPDDDVFMFAYPDDRDIGDCVADVEGLMQRAASLAFKVDGEEVRVELRGAVLLAPTQELAPDAIERSLSSVLADVGDRDRRLRMFTEETRSRLDRRIQLERDLRLALQTGGFELFVQPKFAAATQRLVGAEALLRWRHPQRGLVGPDEFIAVLEESGLIVEVGAWVRQRALAITRHWHELGHLDLRLAVNVSARELRQLDFVAQCEALLGPLTGEHNLDIEITESLLMDDIGHSIQVLQKLRELGFRIAIDDFGTGYSSLNYLSRLPTDALKIDRSFVALLALSPDTLSLVTQVIGLAHSLGLRVVAEGVEDEEQAKLLRLLRCDELQGYFVGVPMPLEEFEQRFLH